MLFLNLRCANHGIVYGTFKINLSANFFEEKQYDRVGETGLLHRLSLLIEHESIGLLAVCQQPFRIFALIHALF
jgi:hypothetical protein